MRRSVLHVGDPPLAVVGAHLEVHVLIRDRRFRNVARHDIENPKQSIVNGYRSLATINRSRHVDGVTSHDIDLCVLGIRLPPNRWFQLLPCLRIQPRAFVVEAAIPGDQFADFRRRVVLQRTCCRYWKLREYKGRSNERDNKYHKKNAKERHDMDSRNRTNGKSTPSAEETR